VLFVGILVCLPEFKLLANKPKFCQTNQNSDKQTKLLANKPNLFVRTLNCLPRLLFICKLLHSILKLEAVKSSLNLSSKNSQRIPEKSPKKSSKILQKFKDLQKNSKEFSKNFQRIPKEFPKNLQKICKKFPRFWKYLISYIAVRGRNPFGLVFPHIEIFSVLPYI
jgi:hypothetical protein